MNDRKPDGSAQQPLGVGREQRDALRRIVGELQRWFAANARELPWRATRDPYAIWVSEVMLQQTQVATVLPYYARWMQAFPDVASLARAPEGRVLKLWEGLGYYSRARNLHRAARAVAAQHGGAIPAAPEALRALPGVGAYTAAAVGSIAFGHALAVVDGNVRRVIARLTALELEPTVAARALDTLAAELLGDADPSLHNQAMMELGALICRPRSPRCAECPVRPACAAAAAGNPERYPLRAARRAVPRHDLVVGVVRHRGRLLVDQRPYGGLLAGLWDLPSERLERGDSPPAVLERLLTQHYGLRVEVGRALGRVDHAYTHLKVALQPYLCVLRGQRSLARSSRSWRWVGRAQLADYALPRAAHKVLELVAE